MQLVWPWLALAALITCLVAFLLFRLGNRSPLRFLRISALVVFGFTVVGAVANSISLIWGSTTSVSINTAIFWPANPPTFEYQTDGTAVFVSGGFSTAMVELSGLSLSARLAYLLSMLSSALVIAMLCNFVIKVSRSLEMGDTFTVTMATHAGRVGWVVLVAGLIASIALQIARYLSQVELFGFQRNWDWGSDNGTIDNPWLAGQEFEMEKIFGVLNPQFQLSIDIWPIVAAVGLLVSAKILKSGQEIKHELEGLV